MSFIDGQQIGQYTITQRIGSGGMAVVYAAQHTKLNRNVAIKVMHAGFQDDEDLLARFRREAQIVATLEHPHIVPVYDFDEYQGQPYLVMRLIQGKSLKAHMRKRPLPLQEISTICSAIAQALTYAHQRGVLHRDVKPANVMIDDQDEKPYLTDFGLARIAAQGESSLSAGMIVGTPHYLAPEQARGDLDLTPAVDVYALGVMLYEMVVGRVPFASDSTHTIIFDQIYTAPPPPSEVNPEIPLAVERVLLKALEKSPTDRYPTPNALMEAFASAIQASGLRELSQDRSEIANRSIAHMPKRKADPIAAAAINIPVTPTPAPINTTLNEIFTDVGRMISPKLEQARDAIRTAFESSTSQERPYIPPTDAELESQIRKRVQRRIQARRGWWAHLFVFVVVNTLLVLGSGIGLDIASSAIVAEMQPLSPTSTDYAQLQVALVSVEQTWAIILTLFWAGALMAHRVQVNNVGARVDNRREKAIERSLALEFGDQWSTAITEGQYIQAQKRVTQRFCQVANFWSHGWVFLFCNVAFAIMWSMVGDILIASANLVTLQGDTNGASVLVQLADQPVFLLLTFTWGVALLIHALTILFNRGLTEEHELAQERSFAQSRRFPIPEKRKQATLNSLQDDNAPPVRVGADGELTNSTVQAWEKQR